MADQVAVALDNARLFSAAQHSLQAAEQAYGELSHQAWLERLHGQSIVLQRDSDGLHQSNLDAPPAPYTLQVPIRRAATPSAACA